MPDCNNCSFFLTVKHFSEAFLLTYYTFITPEELISRLLYRWATLVSSRGGFLIELYPIPSPEQTHTITHASIYPGWTISTSWVTSQYGQPPLASWSECSTASSEFASLVPTLKEGTVSYLALNDAHSPCCSQPLVKAAEVKLIDMVHQMLTDGNLKFAQLLRNSLVTKVGLGCLTYMYVCAMTLLSTFTCS